MNRILLPLWDYGWCDISEISCKPAVSPDDLISQYLQSSEFESTFTSPEADHVAGVHGPFLSNLLHVSDFELIDVERLRAEIGFIRQPEGIAEPATEDQWRPIRIKMEQLSVDSVWIFRLRFTEGDNELFHDTGGVLWVFREFIFANPKSASFKRLVFGYD
jgi:hypothetical protein